MYYILYTTPNKNMSMSVYVYVCFPSDRELSGRGTHMTMDMCLAGRGAHITRDMCFQSRGNTFD